MRKRQGGDQGGGVIVKSILERVNVFVVDEMELLSEAGESKSEYRFAGCYRKDMLEETLLITISR